MFEGSLKKNIGIYAFQRNLTIEDYSFMREFSEFLKENISYEFLRHMFSSFEERRCTLSEL